MANFNVYKTKADNMIGYVWVGPGMMDGAYYNTGKEDTNGWSLGLTKQFDNRWLVSANYTHTSIPATSSTTNANRDGYIPKGQLNLAVDYTQGKFNAGINGRGIFDRPGRKINESKRPSGLKNFWLFDTYINYKATENCRVFLKVNNIFDKWYTDQLYDMDPDSTSWYSAPGRNFQAGLEFTF